MGVLIVWNGVRMAGNLNVLTFSVRLCHSYVFFGM